MGGKGSGEASKARRGYKGWLIMISHVDQAIKAVLNPFSYNQVNKQLPQTLIWPDIEDNEGMDGLIDAVMAKNIPALETYQREHPEYDLGISAYIERLKAVDADEFPRKKIVQSQALPRGMRVDTEIVVDTKNIMHIRKVIRRGANAVASKILASTPATPHRLKVVYG